MLPLDSYDFQLYERPLSGKADIQILIYIYWQLN